MKFDNHAAAPENVKNWICMDSKWLDTIQDREVSPAELMENAQKHQATIRMQFTKLFDNFFSLIH